MLEKGMGHLNDGVSLINDSVDLLSKSALNELSTLSGMEREPTAGTCAICGRPLTQVGRKGECLRCLADLGFLGGGLEPGNSNSGRRLTPGPLKYDHF